VNSDFAGTKGTVRNIEVSVLWGGLPVIGYQKLLGYPDNCLGGGGVTSVLWTGREVDIVMITMETNDKCWPYDSIRIF